MSEKLPIRDEISTEDKWDLSILFSSRKEWEEERLSLLEALPSIASYEHKIKEEKDLVFTLLQEYWGLLEKIEKVMCYAQLAYSGDSSSDTSQEIMGLAYSAGAQIEQATSFIDQEMADLSEEFLMSLTQDERFRSYTQLIIRLIQQKPHILSKEEEKILAMQSEYRSGFSSTFSALTDIDMDFGTIELPEGTQVLSHATLGVLMQHKNRAIRKQAHEQYLTEFNKHLNTLTNLYAMQVKKDIAHARIRHYNNSLHAKLQYNNIPETLYFDLISHVHKKLPVLHEYYALLKAKLQLDDFAIYDLQAPAYASPPHDMSYEEAVQLVCEACAPLGEEYTSVLKKGLIEDRWVDRYENKGKRSGAFSMGVFGAYPYILMNYQHKSLRQVFTLAHEAGHSMHSYFSNRANPYPQHDYTIFEAEVASTVNEFLLYRHLINNTDDTSMKTYLLWHELQDFISTFFRQTMFAEFEIQSHQHVEQGAPLTSRFFTELSTKLYTQYCGSAVHITDHSKITGLRIPHFYRSYYVYQYATGIAAAVDIGTRIFERSPNAVSQYFEFLHSGGSRFPIDALALAGVDYNTATPIQNALTSFEKKYEELKALG